MNEVYPEATIAYTQVRDFYSNIMGVHYKVSVWFPPDYPEEGQKYPVIYLLDAELLFGQVSSMALQFIWAQVMPQCLVVGISHNVSSYDEWGNARQIDFTPPEDPDGAPPKRANDFLKFFQQELIPYVETVFPIDSADRCLVGYSASGKFTLYTLLHDPDLFHRYFIGSAFGENILPCYLSYEARLAEKKQALPLRVFFSVGSLETDQVPYFHQFIEVLKRRHYQGLKINVLEITNEDHLTALTLAFYKGLKALYKVEKGQVHQESVQEIKGIDS